MSEPSNYLSFPFFLNLTIEFQMCIFTHRQKLKEYVFEISIPGNLVSNRNDFLKAKDARCMTF